MAPAAAPAEPPKRRRRAPRELAAVTAPVESWLIAPPEERFGDVELAVWRETCEQLAARGLVERSDRDAVERYVRAVALVRRLYAEWEKDAFNPLARGGATGRAIVANPLVSMIANAERDANRYAGELLLTSASRLRQGFDRPHQAKLPGLDAASAGPPRLRRVGA